MKILPLIILFCCVSLTAKTAKKSGHSARKTSQTASASRHSASRVRGKAGKGRRRGSVKSATARRSYQQAPSSDRYKEIQEALVAKGYLKSAPDGNWNADTADALKRFQADQNLSTTGKVNSLSLIALGLGPKSPAKP